jgi:hypothetical protein
MEEKGFDFEGFKKGTLEHLKGGKGLLGAEGALTPLVKELLEEALACAT